MVFIWLADNILTLQGFVQCSGEVGERGNTLLLSQNKHTDPWSNLLDISGPILEPLLYMLRGFGYFSIALK